MQHKDTLTTVVDTFLVGEGRCRGKKSSSQN